MIGYQLASIVGLIVLSVACFAENIIGYASGVLLLSIFSVRPQWSHFAAAVIGAVSLYATAFWPGFASLRENVPLLIATHCFFCFATFVGFILIGKSMKLV